MCEHTANTSLQYCAAKKRASNVQTQQVHKHTDTTLSVARIYNNVTQFLQKKKNQHCFTTNNWAGSIVLVNSLPIWSL